MIELRTPVVPAQLHNDAGIIGAAMFAPVEQRRRPGRTRRTSSGR